MKMFDRLLGAFGRAPASAAAAAQREAAGAGDYDDETGWRKLSGDSSRDLSPVTADRMREMAYYLWQQNMLANRLIELPVAFLLAEGVAVSAEAEEMRPVIDRFWRDPINQMDLKLPKKVRELALFGEQCWPVFENELSGAVRLGYLDPTNIAERIADPDNPEQVIGIVTKKDRKGNYLKYRTIINGPETVFTERTQQIRAGFSDGECFFFVVNDLSAGVAGRSDLTAAADWVDAYETYLFGEIDRADFMRAFFWDVTLENADDGAIKSFLKNNPPPTSGSVRAHNQSVKWEAVSPDLKTTDAANGARLLRNHILGGQTVPEHWYGGGGDVNRAAASEMGEPTFKILSMRQTLWRHIIAMVLVYVIRRHIIAHHGVEPEIDDPRLVVDVSFPELTSADTTRYAAALQQVVVAAQMAVESGYLTEHTAVALISSVAGRLGVSFDAADELAAAATAHAKRREEDAFTGPGAEDMPPPPPAGGDMSEQDKANVRNAASASSANIARQGG